MRAVLDTNVIVSAVLSPGSPPDSILRASRRGALDLVTSAPVLRELDDVLGRPRIAERLGWTPEERASFIAALADFAVIVAPKEKLHVVKADPADTLCGRARRFSALSAQTHPHPIGKSLPTQASSPTLDFRTAHSRGETRNSLAAAEGERPITNGGGTGTARVR